MAGRIFLANVGANASHRFASPLLEDGTFEFLPIPETPNITGPHATRYRDLRSHNDPNSNLLTYIPKRLWDTATHNDPEFVTFTYGDNCEVNPRASSLKYMVAGDCLFFIARLENWRDGKKTGEFGFYLVGFLEIEDVLASVTSVPDESIFDRFGKNAHIDRGLSDTGLWDSFWVFGGSSRSRRFEIAVPVTREFCIDVFSSADGSPWRWDAHRSDLQVIGSYTRSCRCVIDPARPNGESRLKSFWDWVERHSPSPPS